MALSEPSTFLRRLVVAVGGAPTQVIRALETAAGQLLQGLFIADDNGDQLGIAGAPLISREEPPTVAVIPTTLAGWFAQVSLNGAGADFNMANKDGSGPDVIFEYVVPADTRLEVDGISIEASGPTGTFEESGFLGGAALASPITVQILDSDNAPMISIPVIQSNWLFAGQQNLTRKAFVAVAAVGAKAMALLDYRELGIPKLTLAVGQKVRVTISHDVSAEAQVTDLRMNIFGEIVAL